MVRDSEQFAQAFTGFSLLDAVSGEILADVNGARYFTPASNTKVLTLYASLSLLGDSLPGLELRPEALDASRTVMLVRPTGDPTFLHPDFAAWQAPFDFLKKQPGPIWVCPIQPALDRFGPGWAWDDYPYDFQAERSQFPMYGNAVRLRLRAGQADVSPRFFQDHFEAQENAVPGAGIARQEFDNQWFVSKSAPSDGDRLLPFTRVDRGLLLSDTLGRLAEYVEGYGLENSVGPWRRIPSAPVDTVLRLMMQQSDNFLAEQLLLTAAKKKTGRFDQDSLIRWLLDSSALRQLPQRPKWVDGSGLSRYNLVTPQAMTGILRLLWQQQPRQRLFGLFPAGGQSGTIAGWYPGPSGKPYVFAKTGSMGGVHCLSGYLVAKSGKVLIFSFMHNNFVGSSRAWKLEMQRVLEQLRQRF
jgi:D-alanyl-D-alanine carboxypeptidase/D-alanyl-D-alanine-endopeptidase (penicillin-binding protein 4)